MRPLTKRDVEALLDAAAAAPDVGAPAVDALVAALAPALARVLALPSGTAWGLLVDAAASAAGWPDARRLQLRDPDPGPATTAALWDLVTELNELRVLDAAPRTR